MMNVHVDFEFQHTPIEEEDEAAAAMMKTKKWTQKQTNVIRVEKA